MSDNSPRTPPPATDDGSPPTLAYAAHRPRRIPRWLRVWSIVSLSLCVPFLAAAVILRFFPLALDPFIALDPGYIACAIGAGVLLSEGIHLLVLIAFPEWRETRRWHAGWIMGHALAIVLAFAGLLKLAEEYVSVH